MQENPPQVPQTYVTEPVEMDDTTLFRPLDNTFLGMGFQIGSSNISVRFDTVGKRLIVAAPPSKDAKNPDPREVVIDLTRLTDPEQVAQLTIGRTQGTLNIPTDHFISSRHLEICVKPSNQGTLALYVRDLRTRNGTTFTEKKRIPPTVPSAQKEQSARPLQKIEGGIRESIPVRTVEPAPLLRDIVDDTSRTNKVWNTTWGRYPNDYGNKKIIVEETSEHEMLANCKNYLQRKIIDDPNIRKIVMEMEKTFIPPVPADKKIAFQNVHDNLQIIGEKELATAASSIADRLIEDMQAGHPIRLYQTDQGGPRSENFVLMYVMEELKRRNISVPIQKFTNVSNSRFNTSDRIHFIDDFLVSGARTMSSLGILADHLRKQGYSLSEIQKMIKLNYVAVARSDHIDRGFSIDVDDTKLALDLFAHYRPNSNNQLMTGVYTTNDYGFENPMTEILGRKSAENQAKDGDPHLMRVHKPYEKNDDGKAPNIQVYRTRMHKAFSSTE